MQTREKYGFLYNGYKKKFYYWESVNMYRKIAIICISVYLRVAGVITQALVVFLVLILFLILNVKLMPFTFKALNDMELMSLVTTLLTIYWGLFYLSDQPEVYNSTDPNVEEADNGLRLNEDAKLVFFIVIFSSNILFFIYWLFKIVEEIKNTMRSKMSKLYLYIFLWGNKKKFEAQKQQRAIEDQNDILKEEFEHQLEQLKLLVDSGEILLDNKVLEKSALYLAPQNYSKAVLEKIKPTEDQMKKLNRERRKLQGHRMHLNLLDKYGSFPLDDQKLPNNNYKGESIETGSQFEEQLDKFLELPHTPGEESKQKIEEKDSSKSSEDSLEF